MNRTFLLTILLLLWLLAMWLLFRLCGCWPLSADVLPATITNCENEKIEAAHSIQFQLNSAKPDMATGANQLHLELLNYLKSNEKAGILITGKSDAREAAADTKPNLGMLRANVVRDYFIENDIEPSRIKTDKAMVSHLDVKSGNVNNAVEYTLLCDMASGPTVSDGITLQDGSETIASSKFGIPYDGNAYSYNTPFGEGVDDFLAETVTYLKGNPDKQLVINGYYHGEEENNSIFPNLGIARANQLKNLLIEKGVPSRQFALNGIKVGDGFNFSDGYSNGISFGLAQMEEEAAPTMSIKNINLYFPTGQSVIPLDAKQREFFAELTRYLDYFPDKKVMVTGHTDNQGERASNIRLGTRRANFAADYLVKNGINRNQITTSSKGPDEPIADNGRVYDMLRLDTLKL